MAKRAQPTEADDLATIAEARERGATELRFHARSERVLRELYTVTSLTDLNVTLDGPTELPGGIAALEKLDSLSVDGDETTALPPDLGELSRLGRLSAYNMKLRKLPDGFGKLARLRKAVLWSNDFRELPAGFCDLAAIEELELKWNELERLPDDLGRLATLVDLDLEDNNLKALPSGLAGLRALKFLRLADNKFTRFPEEAFDIPQLELVDLGENKIKTIPPTIVRAKALRELYLKQNEIAALPDELFDTKLVVLEMEQNKIKTVPPGLARMTSLLDFKLWGNEIAGVPEEVIRAGKAAILEHLGLAKPPTVEGDKPADAAAIVKRYKDKLDAFRRGAKKKLHSEDMLERVLAFITGADDRVPPPRIDDHYSFGHICELLAPHPEWTFIERRVIRYIAQAAWHFRQPEHDYYNGYHDEFFSWLAPQLEAEAAGGTLFADIAAELPLDEEVLALSALRELGKHIVKDSGEPTSFGRWLLAVAPRQLEAVARFCADTGRGRAGLTGLLLRHDPAAFAKVGAQLLKIEPDEDGETHIPHEGLAQACAVAPAQYETLLREAIAKTDCMPCKAEGGKTLLEHYPQHRAEGLAIIDETLRAISDRKNKGERYSFPWSGAGRWTDGTPQYIEWAQRQAPEVRPWIFAHVENTKVFDLDVAEVVARTLGQDGLEILVEGLQMTIDDDGIAAHFRRMFTLLAPLDCRAHLDKFWKIATSERRPVRHTACVALAKQDPALVLPRARELLESKKAHEREAALVILGMLPGAEPRAILGKLLDHEANDDARDVIVAALYADAQAIDAVEAKRRVAAAEARGKLAKPVAKWLDEAKLPGLVWAGGKKPVDNKTLRFLFHRQTRRTELELDPEARPVLALIDRGKGGAFAAKLLALIEKNGGVMAKNRFALALCGTFADDATVAKLEEIAIEKRNENAVRAIGLSSADAAPRALSRIMREFRTKYPNVREVAAEAFAAIADARGQTTFELADAMLPDFGLPKLAPKVSGEIGADGKLALVDDKDKPLKGAKIPAKLKPLIAEVNDATKQLAASLAYYMTCGRTWSLDAWSAFFLEHPLASALARRLVWRTQEHTFRVTDDGEFADAAGKRVVLGKAAVISLAYPLALPPAALAAWRAAFADIAQPFPQLERKVVELPATDRERRMSFQFENKELSAGTFKGRADRLGWRRGSVVDSGEVSAYRKVYVQAGVEAFIRTEGVGAAGWEGEATLGALFFVPAGAIVTGGYTYDEPRDDSDARLIKFADLPAMVYSETIADLEAIVATRADD
jgi:Leucine-rich repeat (LRR) protein